MIALVVLSSLAMVLGIYITWRLHGQVGMKIVVHPKNYTADKDEDNDYPLISVIIPARNEERNIKHCLDTLLDQTYPNYEIIVVDDRSSDGTASILEQMAVKDSRIRIIEGEELKEGWAGKPHALDQGASASRGEWLCFMDADTFSTPGLLWSTYQKAVYTQADMFSILTEQELGSFWERTVLPLVFLGLSYGFPADNVNDPAKPDAIANGQFILIKRSVYEAVGGHAAVKERIDEDRAIAALVKHAGYHLVIADGRQVARTRMYTSLPEMWEGWTKNIYLGLQDRLGLLSFGAGIGLVVSIGLPLWLIVSLVWLASTRELAAGVVAIEAILLWGYLLWKRLQACNAFGIDPGYAFTFPIGAAVFTAMMAASVFDVLSGRGVTWKGRQYHRT